MIVSLAILGAVAAFGRFFTLTSPGLIPVTPATPQVLPRTGILLITRAACQSGYKRPSCYLCKIILERMNSMSNKLNSFHEFSYEIL